MLYKLEVENFYSIRDPQTLDLSVVERCPIPRAVMHPSMKVRTCARLRSSPSMARTLRVKRRCCARSNSS